LIDTFYCHDIFEGFPFNQRINITFWKAFLSM